MIKEQEEEEEEEEEKNEQNLRTTTDKRKKSIPILLTLPELDLRVYSGVLGIENG
jgi:hypothetical protein